MAVSLPAGYHCRAPTHADAPAVAALIAACEVADTGQASMTEEALREDWHGLDLSDQAVLLTTTRGEVAAFADLLNRSDVTITVYGHVHPDHRGRGLGAALVAWGEQWARDRLHRVPADARVVVQHYLRATNEPARRLLVSRGYAPVRCVYRMAILLDEPPSRAE